MDLALYDPEFGYYARAAQRSGRAGDFFTSVDVGPLFGELLESQIAEMAEPPRRPATSRRPRRRMRSTWSKRAPATAGSPPTCSARRAERHPALYDRLRLHLVEASAEARARPAGDPRRRSPTAPGTRRPTHLPESFEGVLIANELLDALPVHQVVMRADGLRECTWRVARAAG